MAAKSGRAAQTEPDNSRVLALSDGIFAVAITLLIFNIQVPAHSALDAHHGDLVAAVADLRPRFMSYAVSFAAIGVFWTAHHRIFQALRTHDGTLIWFNMLYLALVGFVPFPTALLGQYPDYPFAVGFYAVVMGLTSLCSFGLWTYAIHTRRLLHEHITPDDVRVYALRSLGTAAVFLVSAPLSIVSVAFAQGCWLAILVLRAFVSRRYRNVS